jgi:predicted nucleotidyltransferase
MAPVAEKSEIAAVCRRYHVRRLSLFGSAAHGRLTPGSDVDLLVEFDPQNRPGMVEMQEFEDRLSVIFGGRRVDIVNPKYLNPRLRKRILDEAQVQYGEG